MTAPSLPEFILARVAVDEQLANDNHVRGCGMSDDPNDCAPTQWPGTPGVCDCPQRRVLRQCEAIRRIVDLHTPRVEWEPYDQTCTPPAQDWITMPDECKTLRALAAMWFDHPDYPA